MKRVGLVSIATIAAMLACPLDGPTSQGSVGARAPSQESGGAGSSPASGAIAEAEEKRARKAAKRLARKGQS